MNKPPYDWLHRPFLLNEEELGDPTITLSNFLHAYSLPEHRELLWSVLKAALGQVKNDGTPAEEVAGWVIYFRELQAFIEASNELFINQNKQA